MITLLPLPVEAKEFTVREVTGADCAALDALYADEEVRKYVGTSSAFTRRPGESPDAAFQRGHVDTMRPAAIAAPTGSVLGALSLRRYDGNGAEPGDFEITIALRKDVRGRRIGSDVRSAVLDALRGGLVVRRVIARVAAGHKPSLHLVQGLHFTKIGEQPNLHSGQLDGVFALDIN